MEVITVTPAAGSERRPTSTCKVTVYNAVTSVLFLAGWVFATLSESYMGRTDGVVGTVARVFLAVLHDPDTQWAVFVFACVHAIGFMALRWVRVPQHDRLIANADLWLCIALGFAALNYTLAYVTAARSTEALVFVLSIALGKAVGLWVTTPFTIVEVTRRALWPVITLAGFLAAASVWHPGIGVPYAYRGATRWTGGWENPNTFGMLMALGLVLSIGCGLAMFKTAAGSHVASHTMGRRTLALSTATVLAGVIVMARGLMNSYSRGAWVASFAGVLYLAYVHRRPATSLQVLNIIKHRRAATGGTLALAGIAAVLVANPERPIVYRLTSIFNSNDFSWRNRIVAWEGSLQMMADRPWRGFGWNRPEAIYANYYLPDRLDESMAIQTNDFLMFGVSTGLPALICLGASLCITFSRLLRPRNPGWSRTPGSCRWEGLRAACCAGCIVLLVGFWFDGGLFKLELAVPFWVLLELGRRDLLIPGELTAQTREERAFG